MNAPFRKPDEKKYVREQRTKIGYVDNYHEYVSDYFNFKTDI